jgi:hypothetical protein
MNLEDIVVHEISWTQKKYCRLYLHTVFEIAKFIDSEWWMPGVGM